MNGRAVRTWQRGVSIVEALVALVVLSVGMLGIASLYVASIKTGRSALLRTEAVNLVNDMLDRIRANPLAREAYDLAGREDTPASQNCVGTTSNCTSEQLAEDDLASWLNAVNAVMPESTVEADVRFVASAGPGLPDEYQVSLSWREGGDTETYSYASSMQILPVLP